jgi:hypothetical protein
MNIKVQDPAVVEDPGMSFSLLSDLVFKRQSGIQTTTKLQSHCFSKQLRDAPGEM